MRTEYDVVVAYTLVELRSMVEEKFKDSWELSGSLQVTIYTNKKGNTQKRFSREMIKTIEE